MSVERVRESVSEDSLQDVVRERTEAGWRLVAMEWERDGSEVGDAPHLEPIPYGFRVAPDCRHLEAEPREIEVLATVAQMIVQEGRLPQIAETLNHRGLRTRDGQRWTPTGVFELMPRLIDASPRIFSAPEWPARRRATVR